ncbi:hypothetical protein FOA52_003003 [Chlamydomonas sp. UWO 241]|nr:hypothetical protein FOA52_003003 [Chlamydomonas sp. UWO 241]
MASVAEVPGEVLLLPEAGEGGGGGARSLNLGEHISLDHLGPVVVHEDGTVSRVTNWAELTPHEQENTRRVLGQRNKRRLEKLKAELVTKPEGETKTGADGETKAGAEGGKTMKAAARDGSTHPGSCAQLGETDM